MPKPDHAGHGRESAPGQNKPRTFVNDAGEQTTGTMNTFHETLKDQGYRPVEDAAETEPTDDPAVSDPGTPVPAI